ncbi:MAG: molecular chaperone TorD family protein [Sandaracinaceae bacterium]
MNEHELARARCLGYGLLADLLARGVTDETRAAASASPHLAGAIEGRDDEALAVELERATGWAAPPFEGAYLAADATIGGASTDALWSLFSSAGYRPDLRRADAEHLATTLRCLAFLSGAEADAVRDAHGGAIERTRALSRRLLDEHALRWVPVWAAGVRRVGLAFPAALATAVEDLLLAHRSTLPDAVPGFALPPLELDPADPETDLRAVATALVTPARSGLVVTRADLERLGRGVSVPRGFGERAQVTLNLLRSAARFEVFETLLEHLVGELEAQRAGLEDPRYAQIRSLVEPWRRRAAEMQGVLRAMRAATE